MEASLQTPESVNDALYNHLVLPAQLPQRREHDRQLRMVETALVNRLAKATNVMAGPSPSSDRPNRQYWESIHRALVACHRLNRGGRIDKSSLISELQLLGPSGCLILHVESQNAGLIIRRAQE